MATQLFCNSAKRAMVGRIREAMRQRGISGVRELSRKTRVYDSESGKTSQVSKSGLHKILNGESFPTYDTLLAIARACDVAVTFFIAASDSQSPAHDQPNEPQDAPEPQDGEGDDGGEAGEVDDAGEAGDGEAGDSGEAGEAGDGEVDDAGEAGAGAGEGDDTGAGDAPPATCEGDSGEHQKASSGLDVMAILRGELNPTA